MTELLDQAEQRRATEKKLEKIRREEKEQEAELRRQAKKEEDRIKNEEWDQQRKAYHQRIMETHPEQAYMDHIVSQVETNMMLPERFACAVEHGNSKTQFVLHGGNVKLPDYTYFLDEFPGFKDAQTKKNIVHALYYCGDIAIQVKNGPFKDWWIVKKTPLKLDFIFPPIVVPVYCTTITLQKKSPFWLVNNVF